MLCLECQEKESTTILGLCKDCYTLKEAFYPDEIVRKRDKLRAKVYELLYEECEMIAGLDLHDYSMGSIHKLQCNYANKIKNNVGLLKELDLIKDNTRND